MKSKNKVFSLIMLLMVLTTMFFVIPKTGKDVQAGTIEAQQDEICYTDPETGIVRYEKPLRENTSSVLTGNIVNLVVLFKFKDEKIQGTMRYGDNTIDVALNNTLNESPISVKNYFKEVSLGKVNYHSFFVANGTNYLVAEAPYTRGYYMARNDITNPDGYTGSNKFSRTAGLVRSIIDQVDDFYNANLENFTKEELNYFNSLDSNNDGRIDSVTLLYLNYGNNMSDVSGNGEIAQGDLLWPQSGELSAAEVNGYELYKYSLMPQDRILTNDENLSVVLDNYGKIGSVSTICHETAHMFGLPDLYSVLDNEYEDAVSGWDLMSSNHSPNPQYMNSYLRYAAGWLGDTNFEEIKYNGTYSLDPVSYAATTSSMEYYHSPVAYYIRGTGSYEDQLIVFEYREYLGAFEGKDYTTVAGIPNNGLLIYRVDLGVTPSSGYENGDIFTGNYGNSPYSIYYFRPQAEDGSEGISANAAFKNGAGFGTISEVTNQITFQSYTKGVPQDVILPEEVSYVNSNIVVSNINIINGKIEFTVSADGLLIDEEQEPVSSIPYGVSGISDRFLYDALLEITGLTELKTDSLLGLTELILNNRNITNLSGLSRFKTDTIKRIVLDSNRITQGYSELLAFKNLEILQLSNMGLTDETFMLNYFRNIYNLNALTAIDVSKNSMTNFAFGQILPNTTLKNIMFNMATEDIVNYSNDASYVIGPQHVVEKYSLGDYRFKFYYSPELKKEKIALTHHRRKEVSENLTEAGNVRITASTFGEPDALSDYFYNEIRVTYHTSCPFYYNGANYGVKFYSIPITVDTELEIRYCGEGAFTSDGITFDQAVFENAFNIQKVITRFEENGTGAGEVISTIDINVVGQYEIFYQFTHKADADMVIPITKWVHVLSNDEITREDMPDTNLYSALLNIVNVANGTNITTLHSQDLARINLTTLELVKLNIVDLTGLEKMNLEKITKLDVTGNLIISIAPLENMTALTTLLARNNLIADVNVLLRLLQLDLVDLSFNRINDIQPLKEFLETEGVDPTCVNINMNFVNLDSELNSFVKENDKVLVLVQGLESNAHYINSVGYQFYQYGDLDQDVIVKFKKGTRTQVMTNDNYFVAEDGQLIISINATATSIFGAFNPVSYDVVVSTFSLAPITYLEAKFLETENEVLEEEFFKKPVESDIIRNNTLGNKGWAVNVKVADNFSNFEEYVEDPTFMCLKIATTTARVSYKVTYTVETCYKNTTIVCQSREFTRTITVINNLPVDISDTALKNALREIAGKNETQVLYQYDLYNITDLDLSGRGIKNMYGIQSFQFRRLTVLRLNDNRIETDGINAQISVLRVFTDLVLLDLSNNNITNTVGLHLFAPKKALTLVLFNNQIAPTEDNQYCYNNINAIPGGLTIVTGVQCAQQVMRAFNQDVYFYYNPVNVNVITQRFTYGATGVYNEETYKVVFSTPIALDTAVFSYVYGIDVNIVFEVQVSKGTVSIPNNTIDVEVYSDFVDEELIYEGIPKSDYTMLNVEYRKDGQLNKLNYLRNTELAAFEQTFTLVLNSTQQPFAFSKWINVVDTTKPVVSLIGDSYIYLETGDEYEEFGIIVEDNYYKDLAIVKSIPPRDEVNNLEKGVYVLNYYATDGSGNVSEVVQRTVEVDYHDFLRFEIRGGDPLVYVGEASFEAYYMGLNTDHLGYFYYDPEPTFYWYVNDELVYTSKDLTFKYTPETAGRFNVELRINNKIMNAKVCSTELLVLFDDEVAMYTAIGITVGTLVLIGIGIWIYIYRKKRREMYMEYSNETYRSARRK